MPRPPGAQSGFYRARRNTYTPREELPLLHELRAAPPSSSVALTWLCSHCRSWTMRGAWKVGRCNFCHTPRPDER